jgi:hypothetical protein
MKKIFFSLLFVSSSMSIMAQDDNADEKFFKKENVFTGGTLNLSFGNLITNVGISPFFGYSINRYIDVAGSIGFNYVSQRDFLEVNDRLRQTLFGPGAFVRIFPIDFVFAQAQYEYNIMTNRYRPAPGSLRNEGVFSFDAHSLLLGGGISSGRRFPQQKSYYYFSVLWDFGNAPNSPYKDNLNRSVPIIRAGYNIALFQGGGRRRSR